MTEDVLLSLTADIVSAHVLNNAVAVAELPNLIDSVHGALRAAVSPASPEVIKIAPAVSIRSSIKPGYLICLEDGKQMTMLKRYLAKNYDLTPEAYRTKWGLSKDYPMVAPNYAARRRELAHAIGLGRKVVENIAIVAEPTTVKPAAAGRRNLGIAAAKAVPVAHLGGEPVEPAKPAKRGRKPKTPVI